MTYLQLVQSLRRETGYASAGPSTTVGASGAHERAANWVASAYTELQNRHDWRWLRKSFSLTTVADTAAYSKSDATDDDGAITRLKRWVLNDPWNPPKCYLSSSGIGTQGRLIFLPWAQFCSIYRIGTEITGAPSHITIDHADQIVLGPTPDDVYIVTGEYQRSAQTLSADATEPEMPSDYHMAIVYGAMKKYGLFERAEEIITRGHTEGRPIIRQLEMTQLPKMRSAGPMI